MTCIRAKGHDGLCRCKAERFPGGVIQYAEWKSENGQFKYHVGYRAIYAKNAEGGAS